MRVKMCNLKQLDKIVCSVFLKRYALMLNKSNDLLRENLLKEYENNIINNASRKKYLENNSFCEELLSTPFKNLE